MKAQAIVRLDFSSERQFKVVLQALKPETEASSTTRSRVQISIDDNFLILVFMAKDTSALRASMNSYLRLVGVAMNLKKLADT
jgi:KEOPS complex subunit Pcc1